MNSDIAPLLAPSKGKSDIGFHQGRVISWNQSTSENVISMAGAVLTNVPVLNGTEPLTLKEGDIVGMLRFKTSYFVLGRIVIPGQSDVGTLPGLQQGVGATETSFSLGVEKSNAAEAVFNVPEWANQALVLCTANATIYNPEEAGRFAYITATVNGGFGGYMYAWIPQGEDRQISSTTQYLIGAESYDVGLDGPIPLGSQIRVAATMWASTSISATPDSIANVHAIAMFRKV